MISGPKIISKLVTIGLQNEYLHQPQFLLADRSLIYFKYSNFLTQALKINLDSNFQNFIEGVPKKA